MEHDSKCSVIAALEKTDTHCRSNRGALLECSKAVYKSLRSCSLGQKHRRTQPAQHSTENPPKMLCPSTFQPHLSPFMDFHWPVRSLWPETRPLFFQIEKEMMRDMQEMRHNLEFMERLHRRIFDEIDNVSPMTTFKPISFQIGKEGSHYALTLDTKDFTPEELSVKQVGRKLRVSGKTEKKQDDGKGSFSYRCKEFRQEFDLPEGVDPEVVTCSLNNGQLQIQAPKEANAVSNERVIPITYTPAVKSPVSLSPQPESQATEAEATDNWAKPLWIQYNPQQNTWLYGTFTKLKKTQICQIIIGPTFCGIVLIFCLLYYDSSQILQFNVCFC